jgi:hypothetical protein
MGSTVEVLGAFTLVFSVFNGILGVLLLHLSLLNDKSRRLVTFIYNHAGYESLHAVRSHYARGNIPISHEDAIQIIEDVTDPGKGDWSKEQTMYTDDDVANLANLRLVTAKRVQRAEETRANKVLEDKMRELNRLECALGKCQYQPNQSVYSARGE